MIFLSAIEPNVVLTVYDAHFHLQPLTYPEVKLDHILVMEDEMGKRILQRDQGKLQKISFNTQRLPGFPRCLNQQNHIPDGSRILIIRGGGIGDVLMCTPAIRALREYLPENIHLTVSTFESNKLLFTGNPYVDSVRAQPFSLGELLKFDYYLEFKDAKHLLSRIHMIDFYLKGMGLNPSNVSDKVPVLSAESIWDGTVAKTIKNKCNGDYHRTIYLNGLASDPLRDVPPEILKIFPHEFPNCFFIVPISYQNRYPNESTVLLSLSNVMSMDTEQSLSAYVTALYTCDGIVTTDSSAYHIGAAIGKPCLALFGSIDSKLRVTYYPTVMALDAAYHGKTCKSPCGKSMFSEFYGGSTEGQPVCPEAVEKKNAFSPCLGSFSKGKLLDAFEMLLEVVANGSFDSEPVAPCAQHQTISLPR